MQGGITIRDNDHDIDMSTALQLIKHFPSIKSMKLTVKWKNAQQLEFHTDYNAVYSQISKTQCYALHDTLYRVSGFFENRSKL